MYSFNASKMLTRQHTEPGDHVDHVHVLARSHWVKHYLTKPLAWVIECKNVSPLQTEQSWMHTSDSILYAVGLNVSFNVSTL